MALSKTLSNDFGDFPGAYHKVYRFEFRTAGSAMEPSGDKDGFGNDVLVETENTSGEVQVHVYPNKTKADADARPLEAFTQRFVTSDISPQMVQDAAAEVGPMLTVDDAVAFMKGILYRALKSRPQFSDAADV